MEKNILLSIVVVVMHLAVGVIAYAQQPRPGGNITRVTNLGTELGGKRLELLKQAVPKVARVAVSIHQPLRPAYWR